MRRILSYRFRRSTVLLLLFLGVLGGLGLARAGYAAGGLECVVALGFLVFSWRRRSVRTLLLVTVFGLACGLWRGAVYMEKLAAYEPLYYQKITIVVRASEDGIYGKGGQMAFAAGDITLEDGRQLTGKIQLSGFGANAVFQGDEIVATGKLYPGYGAYQGRMSFAVLQVTAHHPSLLAEVRRRFVAGAQSALPDPLAPFVMGLLVGQRATLPDEVKDDLRTVGLTHIIAVSGYNLTIILNASQKLMGKKSKRISTGLSLALIGVFLLLAGGSASIVRAAVVSVLSIAAAYYGRNWHPLNLLAFAAVLTAGVNPVYIWSDLSWYLSFLAFFGVMVLSPLIQARLPGKWHQTLIGAVALETICAELITLPFVLHVFGEMSHVGLLANVLVVTLVPLAMLLGLVSGLAGMLCAPIAGWFTWPAVILLNYMLDLAHVLAHLPHSFVDGIGLTLHQMLGLYAGICLWTAVLWHKTGALGHSARNSGIITDMTQSKSRGLMT